MFLPTSYENVQTDKQQKYILECVFTTCSCSAEQSPQLLEEVKHWLQNKGIAHLKDINVWLLFFHQNLYAV